MKLDSARESEIPAMCLQVDQQVTFEAGHRRIQEHFMHG